MSLPQIIIDNLGKPKATESSIEDGTEGYATVTFHFKDPSHPACEKIGCFVKHDKNLQQCLNIPTSYYAPKTKNMRYFIYFYCTPNEMSKVKSFHINVYRFNKTTKEKNCEIDISELLDNGNHRFLPVCHGDFKTNEFGTFLEDYSKSVINLKDIPSKGRYKGVKKDPSRKDKPMSVEFEAITDSQFHLQETGITDHQFSIFKQIAVHGPLLYMDPEKPKKEVWKLMGHYSKSDGDIKTLRVDHFRSPGYALREDTESIHEELMDSKTDAHDKVTDGEPMQKAITKSDPSSKKSVAVGSKNDAQEPSLKEKATKNAETVDWLAKTQTIKVPAIIFHVQAVSADMSKLQDDSKYLRSPFIQLQINKPCIFGRNKTVDVPLSDSNASRKHMKLSSAVIKKNPFEYLEFKVKNLSKANPVKINDFKLCEGKKVVLNPNDMIKIGQNSFRVQINCTEYNNSEGIYLLELRLPQNSPEVKVPITPQSGPI